MKRDRRLLPLLLILVVGWPAPVAARAAENEAAPIDWFLETSGYLLPTGPHDVTVSRVVFTPGADATESIEGLRLVVVESGALSLRANGDIPITRLARGPGPGPTPTPSPVPSPTPVRSPTTETIVSEGDAFPVPKQLLHRLRNESAEPAVIIDVRITIQGAAAPPAELDAEMLAREEGIEFLTTGQAYAFLGAATVAPGGIIEGPDFDWYQIATVAAGDRDQLERGLDPWYRNVGTTPLDAYVMRFAPAEVVPGAPEAAAPRQPEQPATGPGGRDYPYDRMLATHLGPENYGVWIFEPADPASDGTAPAAGPLPVLLFLHGCCMNLAGSPTGPPEDNTDWLEHLARRGVIVIYPIYRHETPQQDITTELHAAMTELETGRHAQADFSRFAIVGGSFGGIHAPLYAARAAADGLPVPSVVISLLPGDPEAPLDLSRIAPSTYVIVAVAADDDWVGDQGAKRIWAALGHIPSDRRDYVRFLSDGHGQPPLVADHGTAAASRYNAWGEVNPHDWYGTWKLLDALMACSFEGGWCEYALGNTPEQRFMGVWSDGVPVAELEVLDDPGPPSATPTA